MRSSGWPAWRVMGDLGPGDSTAGRGGPRPRAAGIVGQCVRGRTPGLPPAGVRPRRWRCGCRARTARRSRRRGRVCESTTTATGRPRGPPPPWRRTGRRRSARRPRRAGCPLTPRLRREHATGNGSGQPVSPPSTRRAWTPPATSDGSGSSPTSGHVHRPERPRLSPRGQGPAGGPSGAGENPGGGVRRPAAVEFDPARPRRPPGATPPNGRPPWTGGGKRASRK